MTGIGSSSAKPTAAAPYWAAAWYARVTAVTRSWPATKGQSSDSAWTSQVAPASSATIGNARTTARPDPPAPTGRWYASPRNSTVRMNSAGITSQTGGTSVTADGPKRRVISTAYPSNLASTSGPTATNSHGANGSSSSSLHRPSGRSQPMPNAATAARPTPIRVETRVGTQVLTSASPARGVPCGPVLPSRESTGQSPYPVIASTASAPRQVATSAPTRPGRVGAWPDRAGSSSIRSPVRTTSSQAAMPSSISTISSKEASAAARPDASS